MPKLLDSGGGPLDAGTAQPPRSLDIPKTSACNLLPTSASLGKIRPFLYCAACRPNIQEKATRIPHLMCWHTSFYANHSPRICPGLHVQPSIRSATMQGRSRRHKHHWLSFSRRPLDAVAPSASGLSRHYKHNTVAALKNSRPRPRRLARN